VTLPSGYQFSPTGAGTAATDSDSDPTTGRMPTTTLISNEDDLSWDAGLVPLASIGDRVWIDLNDNGVQDGGESGLSGVTVRLLDASGNRVDNPNIAGNQDYILTTDTNGNYQFVNLTPDVQYRVEFVRPSGYLFSTQDAGSPNNDATDSDANPADGRTIATLLSPGENDLTWDAGFVPLASLGNFVWNDANHNGIQDNGESGLAGVTVTLRDSNGVQVTTDGNGNAISPIVTNSSGAYSFTNLSPRIDYIVEFSRPDGWKRSPTGQGTSATDSNPAQSGPNAGRTAVIDLAPGEANDTIDAGYSQLATLGDFIWNDANGDGIQNNGETGIAGATVTLLDGSNNPVTTDGLGNAISAITTDSSGAYLFPNLNAGTYRIQVTPPTGYVLTLQDQGVDTADSDVDRFTGRSADYVLGWGQTDLTADAGVFQPARLGNYVWEDLNYNGQQNEPASSGVNGVTVRLLDSNGVRVDDPNTAGTQDYIVTTANDGGGNPGYYEFTGLFPGSYIVEFVAPSGAEFTQPNTGADVSDSDANVSTGRTGTYTLAANGSDQTADAGIFYRTSIGDRVWIDLNNNGVQDGGESGYQGATVTLYTGAGVQVGTPQTTSSSGNYLFDNLLPGDYYVVVTLPSGYQFSPTGAGTSTTDSDSDPITGRMPTTTLISNEDDLSWDAGLVPLASIGDKVWNDVDGDGAQDSGEAGVGGVTVHLYRDGGTIPYRTTTTSSTVGSEGDYLFDDVPPGDYFLEFVAPSGMMFTRQDATTDTTDSDADRVSGRTITTTLSPGEDDWTWDAGILQPAAIGDYIWEDVNDNGQQDESASSGQNGITVRLLDSNGNAVDNPNTPAVDTYEVTTADNGGNPGYYAFTGLFPADYVVEFVLPSSNWVFARPNQGMDTSDSDASRTNGRTSAINLIAGETDNTVDAGLLQLASLGDRIWIDLDNNGVQDGGEPGYQGATVTLYDGTGTQVGSPQTTDANGDYRFSDLVPGDYYVVVTLPSGYQFSPTGAGTNSTDSDSDFTTGRMPTTTLISGEDDDTWDAGLVPLASIGDRVWRDDNGNGVQDAGEPGLGGVTVHLHRNGDTAPYRMTTTSSASGSEGIYRFENVPPGDYFIEFVRPAGYISSPQDSSLGTEATDSNADTTTGRTFPTNLSPGEDDRTWDAGFVPLGSIGDRVWMDYSKDGVQDPGEESLIGIGMILTLPDGSTLSTMTNSSGLYLFERLAPGVYTVTVDTSTLPAGVYQTYDLDGFLNDATTYTLGANENVRTLDFGYAPVWNAPTPPPDDQPTPTPTPVILGTPATSAVSNVDGVTVIPAENALVCSTGCPNFRLYHTDETGDWEIFRLDSADPQARTTSRVNLSLGTGQGVNDMAPSLSPNSQWIVFTSNRDTQPGQPENWEIYVAPTSGGNPDAVQRVTVNHFANDTDPVWGPNNWVVFESNRNGNWDLYAVDMSTGIEVRLTDDPTDDINAFWSPDGSKLVFQSQRDGQWQIYELTLATGDVRRLSDGSAIDVDPVYSPDGTRIAFRTYSAGNANSVISLMNGDGTGRTAISSADGNATNQVWSPDGALIAYQSDLDGDLDIYVFELSSQGTRQITDNTIPDYAPAWRCSNDIVLFTSDIAGDPNIYEENARPMTDPAVLVEIASDQLTFETFDDIYPQMSPSEENASREGQTPDGVFGQQTEFLRPVVERTTPDLSIDGITREVWNPLDGCQPAP
ncbi:MAG: SdrD B-like domain-containing protein, partial [Anaerolineae bacterium]